MRVKKKRVPKPKPELTEEERLQAQARAMAEGRNDAADALNDSIYSYYTEKTDLNESVMAASAAGTEITPVASPDKRNRSPPVIGEKGDAASTDGGNDVKILAELENEPRELDNVNVKVVGSEAAQVLMDVDKL